MKTFDRPIKVCVVNIKTGESIILHDIVSYKVAYQADIRDCVIVSNIGSFEIQLKFNEELNLSDAKFWTKDYVLILLDSGIIINNTINGISN